MQSVYSTAQADWPARIISVGDVETKMKQLITLWVNAANWQGTKKELKSLHDWVGNVIYLRLWDTYGLFSPGQKTRAISKKKRTVHLVYLAVSVDHWVKIKESDKILESCQRDEKLWYQFYLVPLELSSKAWKRDWVAVGKRKIETIQTTALLRSARILRKVQVIWGVLLSFRFYWKTVKYCWWGFKIYWLYPLQRE